MRPIYIFVILLLLSACNGESDSQQVPPENITQGETDVGPFDLKLTDNSKIENNAFSIQIDQEEGKVEYHLAPNEATTWMKIKSHQTNVTGCDANKVQLSLFWKASGSSSAKIINKNQYFSSEINERGTLTVFFQNIGGCSSLSYTMIVEHIADPIDLPKNWSPGISSSIEGEWESSINKLKVDFQWNYISFDSSKDQICIKAYGFPRYDDSQTPHFLGTEDDLKLLCEYELESSGTVMHLNCPSSPDWGCEKITDVVLEKI